MAKFQPYLTNGTSLEHLPLQKGQFIFTKDEGKFYVDISDTERMVASDLVTGYYNDVDGQFYLEGPEEKIVAPVENHFYINPNSLGYIYVNGAYEQSAKVTGYYLAADGKVYTDNFCEELAPSFAETAYGLNPALVLYQAYNNQLYYTYNAETGVFTEVNAEILHEGNYSLKDGKLMEDSSDTDFNGVIPPATEKIYLDMNKNELYRWNGLAYIKISGAIALETNKVLASAEEPTEGLDGDIWLMIE